MNNQVYSLQASLHARRALLEACRPEAPVHSTHSSSQHCQVASASRPATTFISSRWIYFVFCVFVVGDAVAQTNATPMYTKYVALYLRGASNLVKRVGRIPSLYAYVVVISSIIGFLIGLSSGPPVHPDPDSESLESGPAAFVLQQSVSRANIDRPEQPAQDREKVNIFIGIFSPADGEFGDYGRRRKAIRETFLPNLDNVPGIEAKFVIGQVTDPGLARKIEAEQSRYAKSFLAVDAEDCIGCRGVRECSTCMIEKMLAFYRVLSAQYDARWVIKADDDVYLSPLRLTAAAAQWDRMGAEYVGCMKQGAVLSQPDHIWFEPVAPLLGSKYYLHALGAVFVVAGHVVSDALAPNAHLLRRLSFEGAGVLLCTERVLGDIGLPQSTQ